MKKESEEIMKTVEEEGRRHPLAKDEKKSHQAVNEALGFPQGDAFEEDLTNLMNAEGAEDGENIVIALIDVDKFDHVNKDFGRTVGDRVLIDSGTYISSKIPEGATIYRIGGDEFGIIFHGEYEKEDVFLLLEALRSAYDVTLPDGSKMSITIGMSVAFEDANRVQELVRKAESAMFRAKYAGRNRVAMAKEEKMVPKTSHYTQDQLKRLNKLSKREGVGEAILLREAIDMLLKKYDI